MTYKIDKLWLLNDSDKEDKVAVSAGLFDFSMMELEEASENDERVLRQEQEAHGTHRPSQP